MRWPFGPPHLTLKPSKKNQHKKNKKEKKNKTKNRKKQNILKNELFNYQSKFSFFGWVSKISFFWQLGPKSAHPQNTIKIGVSAFSFWKKICVTKRPFLDQKTQIQKFQLSFLFCLLSSLSTTKNSNNLLKPLFL